ncbi:response regulator [Atopomonas sediminilitoris]|uniref:response regulator n=1 Tax=Atopomonas sediminilitoris TaxID=2919919 RepID=UPI001F4D4038|nr:response regulator [Atopomonas sediminilitoris]MCJ8167982.1 response regulator [Atopomonas sediminilitoris]
MTNGLGLRGRILLLTLLPASLLSLLLTAIFVYWQLDDHQIRLLERGELNVRQLARLAANELKSSSSGDQLDALCDEALNDKDVRAARIFNRDGELLAHAGPRMTGIPDWSAVHQLHVQPQEHASRFSLPVRRSQLEPRSNRVQPAEDPILGWVEVELSQQSTQLRIYRTLLISLGLLAVGMLIITLLSLHLQRTVSAPLRKIGAAVTRLKDGHLDTRIPTMNNAELDRLAGAINRMAETLQGAQEEMQHNIDMAVEDLRENMETIEVQNIELDLARKEALEASRIKSEFLANMSHEIRTPLNGILGFTRMLQKSTLNNRQRDFINTIESSAENLLAIINEILDFSKIEAGKLVLDNLPFSLRELLQEIMTLLAPSAHTKHLELLCMIYRDTPTNLIGDPLRLRQILTNLISNAIKFTEHGSVCVRVMLEDDIPQRATLRISVQDTGIGLSPAQLERLFFAFNQASHGKYRQQGGTGLGLVISKRLIEQMGGEIGVQSTPGEGSEFWISLTLPLSKEQDDPCRLQYPLEQSALVLEPHRMARTVLSNELEDLGLEHQAFGQIDLLRSAYVKQRIAKATEDLLLIISADNQQLPPGRLEGLLSNWHDDGCKVIVLCPSTEQSLYASLISEEVALILSKPVCPRKLKQAVEQLYARHAPEPSVTKALPSAESEPPRILCVDDNPANLKLVTTLLSDLGATTFAAEDGFAALRLCHQERFDMALMDVQMPGLDGLQTTQEIRRQEHQNGQTSMPIIALTAHALANEKRALLQGGMDDYLTKPISERQLVQVVEKWTGKQLHSQHHDENPLRRASDLPVLDEQEGLRLAAGKTDLARDMLDMLGASLGEARANIRLSLRSKDAEELLNHVHRLHGATRYCGVPELRTACQQCETLLKESRLAAGLPLPDAALHDLDQAIERLQQALSQRAQRLQEQAHESSSL